MPPHPNPLPPGITEEVGVPKAGGEGTKTLTGFCIHEAGCSQIPVTGERDAGIRHGFNSAGGIVDIICRAVVHAHDATVRVRHPRHPNRVGRSVCVAVQHFPEPFHAFFKSKKPDPFDAL